jgi:hypothetical protein
MPLVFATPLDLYGRTGQFITGYIVQHLNDTAKGPRSRCGVQVPSAKVSVIDVTISAVMERRSDFHHVLF